MSVTHAERDQQFQSQLREMELMEMKYEMDMLKPLASTVEERESKGQEEIKGVGSQGIKAKINCHVYISDSLTCSSVLYHQYHVVVHNIIIEYYMFLIGCNYMWPLTHKCIFPINRPNNNGSIMDIGT